MVDWAEKHRPRSLKDIVGNPTAIKELRAWADSWEHRPVKKAVVLSGDAGVGKTSAALALARDMGWIALEMNASDARTAGRIKETAGRGATQQSFTASGDFLTAREGGRKLIILDEADNLFGNTDRGGAAQIAETVRETGQPIVLIVNDYREFTRRSSSMRTLAKEIKFLRPRTDTVMGVLKAVCGAEGVDAGEDVLRWLAERSQGDLRAALNDLQAVAQGRKRITTSDLDALGKRDTSVSVFVALREIYQSGSASRARTAVDNLDENPEDLILWVDENLPAEYRDADDLARGYEALSRADIFLGRVPRRQHYRLWAFASDLMTAGVAVARKGRWSGGQYRFPLWLAKMGRSKSLRSVKKSIGGKIGPRVHQGGRDFVQETLPALQEIARADPEFRVVLASDCGLEEKEVAFLLGEEEDSEAVKRTLAEAVKLVKTPKVRPTFMERFSEG